MSSEQSTSNILTYSQTYKICLNIIDELINYEQSWPFIEPVDINTVGLENYYNIIKTPMDINTIKYKLSIYQYTKLSEFIDDVDLIWNNCFLFNDRNSEICDFAEYLSKIFKKQINKYFGGFKSIKSSMFRFIYF